MSGKKALPLDVDPPSSRDRINDKEQVIVATETGFFDAMLTFGWLAERRGTELIDGALRVVEVNDALRYWLKANGLAILLDEIKDGVPIKEFLERIIQDEHEAVGGIVEGNLRWITEKIEELKADEVALDKSEFEMLFDKPVGEVTVQRTLRFVNDEENAGTLTGVLAGVRVVSTGAIKLRSINERDRVDIVSVCQVVKEGDGWRVAGYQGLLQQAWLRVKSTIRAGTKEGTVALMGRNMSHNIGSHALFYLEMDELCETKKTFYRYLRERMELLAGFATSMPLSSVPDRLSSVIANFKKNSDLLERIAKSERVTTVNIEYDGKPDLDVAFPGGVLSAQALYGIFENNIRDSAKHGRTEGSRQQVLGLKISALEAEKEFAEEFIKVVVSDDRKNYHVAERDISEALSDLRIVDEVGALKSGDWGIKERFICAALLRGRRLEDIDIQLQRDLTQVIKYNLGDYAPQGEPRILDIANVDGNLGWVFYLLKPKDILLIGDFKPAERESLEQKFGDAINLYDFQWLRDNIAKPSKVRHRFVVVYVKDESNIVELESLKDKLPYRVIVCLPRGVKLDAASDFAPITKKDLDLHNLSLGRLYQLWVNWLAEMKHPAAPPTSRLMRVPNWVTLSRNSNMPEIAFCYDKMKVLKLNDSTGMFHWELSEEEDYEPSRPVLLFDRHGGCKVKESNEALGSRLPVWTQNSQRFQPSILHYEPYEGNQGVGPFADVATNQVKDLDKPLYPSTLGFSFLEAGVTKVLIVDERLDPTSERLLYTSTAKWQCSYKELFRWKGIDIRGGEFASNEIPSSQELISWVESAHTSGNAGYDFLVLHKGIVDKLVKRERMDRDLSQQSLIEELFATLREHVRHVIIHSGRMAASELPPGVKFMSLSNVDTWIKNNCPKMQIVEDLCLLRRP